MKTIENWNTKVKKLMQQKGVNQKQLSTLTGITESSISRYLAGERTPRIDIISNFANSLGVTVDYLLSDENTNENAYDSIAYAIARNGKKLTVDQQKKLAVLLLGKEENV